jgi:putative ABC transport system permease protein
VSGILRPTHGAEDGFVYPRIEDAQVWFQKPGQLTHVLVKLKDAEHPDAVVTALRGCDAGMDMNIVPLTHLLKTIQSLVGATRLLLGAVAVVALLIAFAGVSNAMLMSVSERTREIGLLRAMGASRGDVFRMVWFESLQLSLAGGLAGVLLAFLGSRVVETALRTRLPFAPADALIQWEWWIAAACIVGAAALGGLAALLPASRAVELSPVEAIRAGATT